MWFEFIMVSVSVTSSGHRLHASAFKRTLAWERWGRRTGLNWTS